MPDDDALIDLGAAAFTANETVLASQGGMTASVFRYPTGVAALRIRNSRGSIILLPWQGQQIWDAEFLGRRLTMTSMFEEPIDTRSYLASCGAFFIHCGMLAMGNPGATDTHPLHGEIPNALYQKAQLMMGRDDGGDYMALTGTHEYRMGFGPHYLATPLVKLHARASFVQVSMTVRNLAHRPMPLMYLAHINFRPAVGGYVHDAVPDDARHIRIRTTLPEFFEPSQAFRAMIARLAADPGQHRRLAKGETIDPELVMGLDYPADERGEAVTLMEHGDGTGDFVIHRPSELPRATRWFTRTGDEQAAGMVLPGTAEVNGFAAEMAKGNVRFLGHMETFHCALTCGAADVAETRALRARIGKARLR